jgi:uncharacterized protein
MFVFESEVHITPSQEDLEYFPLYKMNKYAVGNISRNLLISANYGVMKYKSVQEALAKRVRAPGTARDADSLIKQMDEAGVHMACVLPESMTPMSYGARMESTNGWLVKEVSKYPDRLFGVCNVGPMIQRGVKNAVWELEYLVKEKNIKAVKFYPVDDTPINNKELWPYYEKIRDLGVPLFIHTGLSWCIPGRSAYSNPMLLEDVCEDFPEITILAYHMGYPWASELNMCASKYPNVYIGTSLLPCIGHGMGKKAQKLLGEAIMWAGIDKIVWGTDIGAIRDDIDLLKKFQISEEVQREYGYPALTEEDRAKWAGLNLARILKVSPPPV